MLPIIGFVGGVFVGAAIRLGGAPGAALARRVSAAGASPSSLGWSVACVAAGQLLVSLLWVVILFLSVGHLLQGQHGVGVYVAWALTLGAAAVPAQTMPSLFTLTEPERVATLVTLRVTTIVAVVLLFIPGRLERKMGWMPSLPVRVEAMPEVAKQAPAPPPHAAPPGRLPDSPPGR